VSADEEREDDERDDETGGESHQGNGRHLGRFAAVAAASGATAATAIAARKAYTARMSGESGEKGEKPARPERQRGSSDSISLARDAVTSGWAVAKDSVIPVIEDAASRAGGYVAEHSPELVRDVVLPKFIDGFEQAQGKHAQSRNSQKEKGREKEAA
jgi:hypothetical protein